MNEGSTYRSVYMKSADIQSWTKTHGGPFYVEVGKTFDYKYKSGTNVTVIPASTKTVNNVTTDIPMQTLEEDIIKTWVYYDFEPSNVEYYYYKDCIVKDMLPHSGLINGGTEVAITGAWFKYMPEYGVVPHCKFGDKIVRAHYDSTVRIVCTSPPGEELGVQYPFYVSLNGVDWIDSGFKFSYYDIPVLDEHPTDSYRWRCAL